jgi:hypothetical protein
LLDETDRSAAKLSNVKGMSVVENTTDTINVGATIGDSSGFAFVCGYVEELMKIGDTVSKVSTKTTTTRPLLLTLFQLYISDTPLGQPCMEHLKCHPKGSSPFLFPLQFLL